MINFVKPALNIKSNEIYDLTEYYFNYFINNYKIYFYFKINVGIFNCQNINLINLFNLDYLFTHFIIFNNRLM